MSKKTKESLKIVSQERIGKDIYSMWLQADHMAAEAKPGQFLSLYTRDGSKLLPRPISICEIDRENGRIRLVYRVTGRNRGLFQTPCRRSGRGSGTAGKWFSSS